jgi:hypothetical protein
MGFVQIIALRTSKLAEVQGLGNEWERQKRQKESARRGAAFCVRTETIRADTCRLCFSSRMKRQWRTRLCPNEPQGNTD